MDLAEVAKKAGETLEGVEEGDVDKLLEDEQSATLRRGIRDFRDQFADLLDESSVTRLVVIIDDLDRCLPSTIIETLEAIKLFLFTERTAFILGADERLVKYAVRLRFPELPGEKAEVGRDYLEKLIQFPVRVPALSRSEMTNYIAHLLTASSSIPTDKRAELQTTAIKGTEEKLGEVFNFIDAATKLSCPQEFIQHLALGERLGPILATGLSGNPRQCKRFLNTLVMRLTMAEARKVQVDSRVLAKLMLLEYFKPASFRKLAEMQAAEGGKPAQVKELEVLVKEGGGNVADEDSEASEDEDLSQSNSKTGSPEGELGGWIEDPWLKQWAEMEPSIADVDLRPYFYFSRDILSATSSAAQRLTPRAQEILDQIMQPSDAVRRLALSSAKELSDADSAAIFEELATRVRRDENHNADNSPLKRLGEFVGVRPELSGQFVVVLGQLPESALPISIVPAVTRVTQGTPGEASAQRLILRWKDSSNRHLAQAVKRQVEKKGGRQ